MDDEHQDPVPGHPVRGRQPQRRQVYELYMRDPARNLPGAVPRVDFSVWKADEAPAGRPAPALAAHGRGPLVAAEPGP